MRRLTLVALALAVALVGSNVLGARASVATPTEEPDATSGELTVLAYNVAGLPELVSGEDPATNSPLISPLLNAYELVLLQESWGPEYAPLAGLGAEEPTVRLGDLVPALRTFHEVVVAEADHEHRSTPAVNPAGTHPDRPLAFLADGLNRLARHRFGPLERVPWQACHGDPALVAIEFLLEELGLDELPVAEAVDGGSGDCLAFKGFSVATHELAPGVEVDVYNLHADAGGSAEDRAARAGNFRQLAAHVLSRSEGRAVILAGDTNLRAERDAGVWAGFLEATGLADVCEAVDCGADGDVIDKVAFRSGGGVELEPTSHRFERDRFQRADGEPLSDHDPLAVRFRWSSAGSGPDAENHPPATAPVAAAARAQPTFAG